MNTPLFQQLDPKTQPGFVEVWYIKVTDPMNRRSLLLHFEALASANGFRKITGIWANYFERKEGREIVKLALKQTFDLKTLETGNQGLKISDCELGDFGSRGSVQFKGQTLKWDFTMKSAQPAQFSLIPQGLNRGGIVPQKIRTPAEDLRFDGVVELNGQKQEWKDAPGMQGHFFGPKNPHAWTWSHCNAFVNERGIPSWLVFEGLHLQPRILGKIPAPRLASFYFLYNGTSYGFDTLWDTFHCRSNQSLTEWKFQADRDDLSFRGHLKAEIKDFAGVTLEDTDGSLLYCANSNLSDLTILVYRAGKLEATFVAPGTAAYEVASRAKDRYVQMLL
jgi:hypothetical protein